jgi:hypothetical protein
MDPKTEGTLMILAALLVLFSAMLAPWVSAAISILALLGFGVYRLLHKSS